MQEYRLDKVSKEPLALQLDLVHTAGLNAQIEFFAEIWVFCAVAHIVI